MGAELREQFRFDDGSELKVQPGYGFNQLRVQLCKLIGGGTSCHPFLIAIDVFAVESLLWMERCFAVEGNTRYGSKSFSTAATAQHRYGYAADKRRHSLAAVVNDFASKRFIATKKHKRHKYVGKSFVFLRLFVAFITQLYSFVFAVSVDPVFSADSTADFTLS